MEIADYHTHLLFWRYSPYCYSTSVSGDAAGRRREHSQAKDAEFSLKSNTAAAGLKTHVFLGPFYFLKVGLLELVHLAS